MLQGRVLDEDVVKEVSHGGMKKQRRDHIFPEPIVAAANFARGSEPFCSTIVYRKEPTRDLSLNMASTRWKNRRRRKMLITGTNATQHLLSPFSSPYFRVEIIYDYGLCVAVSLSNSNSLTLPVGLAEAQSVPIGWRVNTYSSFWQIIKLFLSVGLAETKSVPFSWAENTYSSFWQAVNYFYFFLLAWQKQNCTLAKKQHLKSHFADIEAFFLLTCQKQNLFLLVKQKTLTIPFGRQLTIFISSCWPDRSKICILAG